MANLGRLLRPGPGSPVPPGLSARSDTELTETLKSRVAAFFCALAGVAVGAASFVFPAQDSRSELLLLVLLTAGAVGCPFAVVGIVRVLAEQSDRRRRRRDASRIRRAREDALRRELAKEPPPRSVGEARAREHERDGRGS